MSQEGWKPVQVSGNGNGKKKHNSSAQILVELVIFNEEIKKSFQDILASQPEFRVKDPKEHEVPRLVILELDEDPAQSFSFIESVVQGVDGREVFLTSPRTDSTVLLDALRAGVKEFFPQPLQKEEVKKALAKCVARCKEASQEPQKKVGQVVCVLGGKGGVGTTSFAVNVAVGLQNVGARKSVVLVEANQQGGDLSLFLDLQQTHSLRDIGADLSRLDTALLTRILSKHSSGVHVLPSGYDDLSSGRLTPECVESTLNLLQSLFDFIVIDCGHGLDLTTKKVLEFSSINVVVSSLLVPVVHRTKRVLDLLRGSGCTDEKLKLVLNRYTPEDNEVLKETEDALKFKTTWVIPNNYPVASSAINNGDPIVLSSPRTPIAKSYQEIASSLDQSPKEIKENGNWVDRFRGIMVGRSKPKPVQAS